MRPIRQMVPMQQIVYWHYSDPIVFLDGQDFLHCDMIQNDQLVILVPFGMKYISQLP